MILTPGQYVRAARLQAGMTIQDVAMCVETDPPVTMQRRAEWIGAIEKDVLPIRMSTALALFAIPELEIDLPALANLMDACEAYGRGAMLVRFLPSPTVEEINAARGATS
jgi:hypothetical protein